VLAAAAADSNGPRQPNLSGISAGALGLGDTGHGRGDTVRRFRAAVAFARQANAMRRRCNNWHATKIPGMATPRGCPQPLDRRWLMAARPSDQRVINTWQRPPDR